MAAVIETRKTVCNRDCPDTCGVVAHIEDGKVVRLTGDPDHPVTQGFLCWRTHNFLPLQYSPDRLTTPLLRGEPVSWDEALDFAAAQLLRIRDESGPAAIFHYRSGGSLGALKHLNDYLFARFGPVTVKSGDICSGAGDAAQLLDFGEEDSNDLFELRKARNVILWGKNAVVSSPHTVPILKESKARTLLIDPVWNKTAQLCDGFVQVRPGGDFALAMAVAQVLFERGWVDPDAASYCDHLDDFRALAFSRADWCGEADVTAAVAADIAARLKDRPCAILVGWGMARRQNGGAIVRALDALGAVSGNLGIAGGGVSYYFKRRKTFDFGFGLTRPPPRTVLEPLFGPQVLSMRDPEIRAIWVTAGNPAAMLPDSTSIDRALRSREFVCVVDAWMTDTARAATLVLPTATLLEDDDLLGAYGHHYVGVSRGVVPPPPGALHELNILQRLAPRLGLGNLLEGTPREWKERILRHDAGFSVRDLEEKGPQRSHLSPKVLFEGRKFNTPSGKVNLITEAPDRARVTREHPLLVMALSTDKAQSSQWSKGEPKGPPQVTVHPDSSGGIADGAVARLESAVGGIEVRVKHDARQRRDVALMTKGGHLRTRSTANLLSRARATDIGGGGCLYDEPARLVPL
jgi:anaerobic selenocysteine-containing dehydrogenase